MTKKEFLDAIHEQMIISCQAVEGEPLYVEEKSIMYLMARAAKQAGTPAIRTSSIRDVVAIKEETELPVIGLVKIQYPGYEGYITPTMKEVDDLTAAGADVVALDCTLRKRGDGTTVNEFIAQIKEKYPDAQIAALTQWWVAAGNLLPKDTFEVWDGLGHAGEGETSIAYYLFPDWCEPEYATCVVPNLPSEVEIKWDFSELTDTAQTGDATKGTAEKGKKMNDVIVEHVVKTLKELDATDWKYKPVK